MIVDSRERARQSPSVQHPCVFNILQGGQVFDAKPRFFHFLARGSINHTKSGF